MMLNFQHFMMLAVITCSLVLGGTCVLEGTLDVYRCDCVSGWGGQHCQARDNCASNPCHNGAVCTSTAQGESP